MKPQKFLIALAFISLTLFSCSKDDDSNDQEEETIQQQVENFLTTDTKNSLAQLGFIFRDGDDQPDISGEFLYQILKLDGTNIPDDYATGTTFYPTTVNFSDLNPQNKTFSFSGNDTESTFGDATATFYSGIGNNFSAYVKHHAYIEDSSVILLQAFSGTITPEGITNAQMATIMVDNNGNSVDYIENNQGRLFIDEDGTAERQ